MKSTNILLAAAAALVASATSMSATTGANAKSHTVKLFQGAAGDFSDCAHLTAVTRTVPTKPTPALAAAELVKGLTAAEKKQGLSSVFSSETSGVVKQVRVSKGTAFVNFTKKASTTLNSAGNSCGREQFFAQMEKTIGQFPNVKTVLYAIDSKPADFYSLLELECPTVLSGSCSGKNF